jgi:hypothetical protein
MENNKVTVVIDADYFPAKKLVDVVLTIYPNPLRVIFLRDSDHEISITIDVNKLSDFKIKTLRLPEYAKSNISLALTYVASYIKHSDELALPNLAVNLIKKSFMTTGILEHVISGIVQKTTKVFIFTERESISSESLQSLFGLPVEVFSASDKIPTKPSSENNMTKNFEDILKQISEGEDTDLFNSTHPFNSFSPFGSMSMFNKFDFGTNTNEMEEQGKEIFSKEEDSTNLNNIVENALNELHEGSSELTSEQQKQQQNQLHSIQVSPPRKRLHNIIHHGL